MTLPYLVNGRVIQLPVEKVVNLPTKFVEDNVMYSLLSSALTDYLIHRYCPIMNFKNDTVPMRHTYSEMYDTSFILAQHVIKSLIGEKNFMADVEGMLASLDDFEQRMKEEAMYQESTSSFNF